MSIHLSSKMYGLLTRMVNIRLLEKNSDPAREVSLRSSLSKFIMLTGTFADDSC
jgi:hypothetical protein